MIVVGFIGSVEAMATGRSSAFSHYVLCYKRKHETGTNGKSLQGAQSTRTGPRFFPLDVNMNHFFCSVSKTHKCVHMYSKIHLIRTLLTGGQKKKMVHNTIECIRTDRAFND